jgi:hypothetical protein
MSVAVRIRVPKGVLSEMYYLETDAYAGDEPDSAFEELIFALAAALKNPRRDGSGELALSGDAAREFIDVLDNAIDIWQDKATDEDASERRRNQNYIRSGRTLIRTLRERLEAAGESSRTKGDAVSERTRMMRL